MEKKPVYCPHGSRPVDQCVLCQRVERKPVFCAHPDKRVGLHDGLAGPVLICGNCGEQWPRNSEEPRAIIGYVESGEDGGRGLEFR